ncbi:GNAT family N-acetyltransferase [bacterium]|nr:MAG: GNAT family N-acetyltransferase [bacterium]
MTTLLEQVKAAVAGHAERSRPTGFGFALAESVSQLDAEAWDGLTAGGSFFLSRRYLSALEAAAPTNLSPRCALLYKGRRPVAAVSCQLVKVKGARLLVAGNLASWGQHAAAFAPGVAPAELWPGVAEALYRIRRAERLSGRTDFVLVKDVPEGDAGVGALRRFGYRPIATDPDMVLDLRPEWRNFADYLAGLQSKYRSAIRGVDKKLAAAGCTVSPLADVAGEALRLQTLYRQVLEASRVHPVELPAAYWPALAEAAGPDLKMTGVYRDGSLLGFAATVRDGDTAVAYYLGYERALRDELPLYFRLLHANIEAALSWGCRRVSFGRTCLEPKAQLGAKPVPTNLWARHPNPLVNGVVRTFYGAVPHGEAPDRDPFKA